MNQITFFLWFNKLEKEYSDSSTVIFDTFFFDKMKRKENEEYVNKLSQKLNGKDHAVVVKHYKNHYILYLLSFGNQIYNRNATRQLLKNTSSIFIFDSLNGTDEIDKTDEKILSNFIYKVKSFRGDEFQDNQLEIRNEILYTFQQPNYIDCGVYCLFYIEKILKSNKLTYSKTQAIAGNSEVLFYRDKIENGLNDILYELKNQ